MAAQEQHDGLGSTGSRKGDQHAHKDGRKRERQGSSVDLVAKGLDVREATGKVSDQDLVSMEACVGFSTACAALRPSTN